MGTWGSTTTSLLLISITPTAFSSSPRPSSHFRVSQSRKERVEATVPSRCLQIFAPYMRPSLVPWAAHPPSSSPASEPHMEPQGLVVSVLISDNLSRREPLFTSFIQLGAGLSVGL